MRLVTESMNQKFVHQNGIILDYLKVIDFVNVSGEDRGSHEVAYRKI